MKVSRFVRLAGILGVAASPFAAVAQTAPGLPAGSLATPAVTVIRAARLFDGRSDRMVENAVVIVEGSKIRDAGSGLAIPPGATVLDLGDATLLPGFIDAHTHMTGEASENWLSDFYQGLRRSVPEQTLLAATYARKTLATGFTTVRNVGAEKDMDVALDIAQHAKVPMPLSGLVDQVAKTINQDKMKALLA